MPHNRNPDQRISDARHGAPALRRAVRAWLVMWLVILGSAAAPARAQGNEAQGTVAVVMSYDTLPYRDALTGLRETLRDSNIALRIIQLGEDGAPQGGMGPRGGTRLTITLGSRATDAVAASTASNALLPCMMLNTGTRAGVLLEHAPEARIALLRQVLPAARVLGVLYSGDRPSSEIDGLREAARRAGLQVVATRIDGTAALDRQIEALTNEVDAVLATFDPGVFSPKNAQSLLLFSYRQRIPLIGVSDAWTRAGALLSTDWDYTDIGRQCGEAALQVLQSGAPLRQSVTPRRIVYSLNRSAARYFRLALSERLAREARHLFD